MVQLFGIRWYINERLWSLRNLFDFFFFFLLYDFVNQKLTYDMNWTTMNYIFALRRHLLIMSHVLGFAVC